MPRNGEIFGTRSEAAPLTVRCRLTDNQIRPHSTRGYYPFISEARRTSASITCLDSQMMWYENWRRSRSLIARASARLVAMSH